MNHRDHLSSRRLYRDLLLLHTVSRCDIAVVVKILENLTSEDPAREMSNYITRNISVRLLVH